MDAPTNEPTAVAPLVGPGAGAGTSVAATALTEAAAKSTAQATFFISMAYIRHILPITCHTLSPTLCFRPIGILQYE
ncbi:hypothetical protein Lal_00019528 [Lupinus albus]|nr:hypothetical protein Lal_00019528 [Lupinus albus]